MASSIFEATRRRAIVAAVVFAAIAVQVTTMGRAQAQPAVASEANREAARAKLVEGVAALKRDDYAAALARFEEAYALVPSPKIHYDFGLAYVGLGRPDAARAAFERFLAEATDAPADKREKAASMIATLRARAEPAGREEHAAAASTVTPVDPPVAAPPVAAPVAQPSEPAAVATSANRDPPRTRRTAAVALGAAGAGLLTAGLVFGLLAQREDDSLTHDSQIATEGHPTPFDPGKESRGVAYERLQIIGLVTGGVAVAAGAALYVTSRRRAVIEPVAGPSLAGASLRVTF